MIVKNRLISRPTLSEAHIVCTLLSPSYASLRARTLAWCFASFGISDACSCRCFSFPIVFPLSRNLCPRLLWFSGKFLGIDYAMLPNCEWNQKQKHKKQPWINVECFAFGEGIVRFASLETSFHAANHTIPSPPSYEGSPHCPKDKNLSPFHGEKPLMTK